MAARLPGEGGTAHPVGERQPSAWGFRDLLGNVLEWTVDWYAKYPAGRAVDPRGPAQVPLRVIRGCSLGSFAQDCRAAYREVVDPSDRWDDVGFRLARG